MGCLLDLYATSVSDLWGTLTHKNVSWHFPPQSITPTAFHGSSDVARIPIEQHMTLETCYFNINSTDFPLLPLNTIFFYCELQLTEQDYKVSWGVCSSSAAGAQTQATDKLVAFRHIWTTFAAWNTFSLLLIAVYMNSWWPLEAGGVSVS